MRFLSTIQIAVDTTLVRPDGTEVFVAAGSWLVPGTCLHRPPAPLPNGMHVIEEQP